MKVLSRDLRPSTLEYRHVSSSNLPSTSAHPQSDDFEDFEFEQKILLGDLETEEYHKLSDDQKAGKLRALADKIDEDNNGTITEKELGDWIEKNHIAYVVKRSRTFFEDTDEDVDGFVTFAEYEKSQYSHPQVPKDYKNSKLYRHEKRRFEYADRDVSAMPPKKRQRKSRTSDPEEVHGESASGSRQNTMVVDVQALAASLTVAVSNAVKDAMNCVNNPTSTMTSNETNVEELIDNHIQETIAGESVLDMNKEEFLRSMGKFKNELDKNGDGLLDKDGQLSYDEIIAMGQLLETSKATQYDGPINYYSFLLDTDGPITYYSFLMGTNGPITYYSFSLDTDGPITYYSFLLDTDGPLGRIMPRPVCGSNIPGP
ncbi:hypothetical protein QZH41_000794 [Actinostola sp. cb2023]|nr:hypothetical protein QZH41_000794 [Actinostola sp. cb2023]